MEKPLGETAEAAAQVCRERRWGQARLVCCWVGSGSMTSSLELVAHASRVNLLSSCSARVVGVHRRIRWRMFWWGHDGDIDC